jgi:hypothetical protein
VCVLTHMPTLYSHILYKFVRSQTYKNRCEANGNAVPLHDMKACRGMEVLLHSFPPLALDAVERFVFLAGPCSPLSNGPPNPLGRRLVEPRSCLDPSDQRNINFTHRESNKFCHSACSLIIIQNELCQLI